jgi:hypothetical protein
VWAQQVRAEERAHYTQLLHETLPAHATLLELGCGAGLPTTRTLAQHFRVIGVDISAQRLARAKRHVPTATFIRADMTCLAFTRPYCDVVVAFYSLRHVPRQEYAALFRAIASWVHSGGWFLATLGLGEIEAGMEADWLDVPMYWSSFDQATSLHLLREAGVCGPARLWGDGGRRRSRRDVSLGPGAHVSAGGAVKGKAPQMTECHKLSWRRWGGGYPHPPGLTRQWSCGQNAGAFCPQLTAGVRCRLYS